MINFTCKAFKELSLDELYEIMVLRQEVFVVEQDCVYLDADGKDQGAWHLLGKAEDGSLVAYIRLLSKGVSYKEYPSISRVLTSEKVRGQGAGKALIVQSLREADRLFPGETIKISAQVYITHLYQSFGFERTGDEYLEDGIPHIAMLRKANGH